jgi:hypothetical protein
VYTIRSKVTKNSILRARIEGMSRRTSDRLMAVVLFACAVFVVGLAIAGMMEFRATRAPVVVVTTR